MSKRRERSTARLLSVGPVLALLVLVSSAGLAAPTQAVDDSAVRAVGTGQMPAGVSLSAWQPIQSQVAKLIASDGAAWDNFGGSVAISGDTAVVGAVGADVDSNDSQGAAYVFYRDQDGADAWGQVATLTADDGAAEDYFGASVAVSGDTAVVGAYGADVDGNVDQGTAYIFYRDQGGPDAWGQVTKLTATDGNWFWCFGVSVSISGDTAVVGAHGAGGSYQGAAYVFYRDLDLPDSWGQAAKLTASDAYRGDGLGISVSVSDDTAVIGASQADVDGNVDQGAAYVFYRDQGGADLWGQVVKLTAADGTAGDGLGQSVAVSGDTAIVGAVGADVDGNAEQGAAYVYYRDQSGDDAWGDITKLTASDGTAQDYFGYVSVNGDVVLVGAPQSWSVPDLGAAYVFYRDWGGSDAWGQAVKLTADDGAAEDYFGNSVSVSGETALVGAWGAEVGDEEKQGAAYVFAPLEPVAWVYLPLVLRGTP